MPPWIQQKRKFDIPQMDAHRKNETESGFGTFRNVKGEEVKIRKRFICMLQNLSLTNVPRLLLQMQTQCDKFLI